jgi:hypothetical protein
MYRYRFLTVVLCLGVLLTWQAWESSSTDARLTDSQAFECGLGGVWRLGGSSLAVVTPTDSTQRSFTIAVHLYEDPTIGGMFGDAVSRTSFVGPVRKIGRDSFEFTVEALGQSAAGQLVYTETITGEMLQVECDRVLLRSRTIFVQDGSDMLCVPFASSMERIRVDTPCDELPPFVE